MKSQKIIMVISFVLIAGVAFANTKGSDKANHSKKQVNFFMSNLNEMKTKLDLTNAQVTQIEKINANYKPRFEEQSKQMRPLRTELRQLMSEENIDTNKVRAKLREISNIEIEQKVLRIEHRVEVQKLLTPDQKKKLAEDKKHNRENKKGFKNKEKNK